MHSFCLIEMCCEHIRDVVPTALSRLIEPFEGPPQGRFACNAGSMIMLFAIMRSHASLRGSQSFKVRH